MTANARRDLPSVGSLLEEPRVHALLASAPRSLVTHAARAVIARVRSGETAPPAAAEQWPDLVAAEVERIDQPSLRRVLNGTGVVLHTNLGRAPLAGTALEAIAEVAGGSNLEYDLETGTRGSRDTHAVALLKELTGAADALVVNNCAAALVLTLNTLAESREAVISRGELIEIGGSFRVPDIMTRSGARLHEVGTTNRTHPGDYRKALGAATAAIVKVHRSNFEQQGYVSEASLRDLAPIAREGGIPLLYDFGSGLLVDLAPWGLAGEPLARDAIRDGASLVVMSGDKLLGGPQAGLIVGDAAFVARCRRNPLARALRVDKLTLAALEATLRLYRDPAVAVASIPVLAMLTADPDAIRERATRVAERLRADGIECEVVASQATVGGGAFPTARIPSFAIALSDAPERVEPALRGARLPVIGRVQDDRVLVDFRSLAPAEDVLVATVIAQALR